MEVPKGLSLPLTGRRRGDHGADVPSGALQTPLPGLASPPRFFFPLLVSRRWGGPPVLSPGVHAPRNPVLVSVDWTCDLLPADRTWPR